MADDDVLGGKFQELPVDIVLPNPFNPNMMDDAAFNRLCAELKETGFIDPIQVIPLDDGKYRILGGEHRWRACRALGWTKVPAIVLTDDKFKDEDLQKFLTVRLNMLHGNLNPEKFAALYTEMAEKYGEDSLQTLMGFTQLDEWQKVTKGLREGLVKSGASPEMLAEFDSATKEIKTIDDLSTILNGLFNKYGDTLQYNFMIFSRSGKELLYIQADDPTFKLVKEVVKKVTELQIDINKPMFELFSMAKNLESLKKQ